MRFGLFASLIITLLLPAVVAAQSLGELEDGTTSFTVSVSPQYPVPYGTATLSFLSPTIDLTSATMTIIVAGKNVYQGSVRPFAVPLGKVGSITNIVVTIASGGTDYRQTLTVQPQDVALIAEPVSSAPVLYPGKPLVPLEGKIRVVAMSNLRSAGGKASSPSALSYSWAVDGVKIANASGIGKTTILVASPLQYRSREISLTVMSQDGGLVGGATLSLSAEEPSVRVYENSPLLGIRFDRALSGTHTIEGAESTLYAAPFSLPTTTGTPLLQWFLNGDAVQTGNALTLRPTGSGRGTATLSFVASAGDYSKATANLSLSFGAQPSTNLFGL
ncbi:MAG: hypothetical protein WC814_00045 [Candidatus Paceibacterota bacterium]|jgi:hypothetical protein